MLVLSDTDREKARNGNVSSRVLYIIVCLVLVFLCYAILTLTKLSDVILLESRSPLYWKYLSVNSSVVNRNLRSIIEGYEESNVLNVKWNISEQNGIHAFVNSDGTIVLNGNNEGKAFNLMTASINLPPGDYYVSMQNSSDITESNNSYNFYIWINGDGRAVDTLPYFHLEKGKTYHCGIHIREGASLNNVIVYPMFRISDKKEYTYVAPDTEEIAIELNYLADEVPTESDFQKYMNRVKYSGYEWSTIVLKDGFGVQFKDGEFIYGELDNVYRVKKPIMYFYTPDDFLSVIR